MKRKMISVERFDSNCEAGDPRSIIVPEKFMPYLKDFMAYQRAYKKLKAAESKLIKGAICKAYKFFNVKDLKDGGDFCSQLDIWAAHFLYERAAKLELENWLKKKKKG